jgi:arylsulfatase A-like enzyme
MTTAQLQLLTVFILSALASSLFAEKPNILWISSEDHGPQMGCYGDTYATTPNLDQLAARGMLFKHAWSCAPVCAPARATIISGMFPASMGAEHMRSDVPMPAGKKMFPQFLREAGYYCSNSRKEDYNIAKPGQVWDDSSSEAHWKNRKPSQPFFAVFNQVATHESMLRKRPHTAIHDPAKVRVPAYHPDTPEVRQDWAQYYDTVTAADALAGQRLKELAEAGLAEETIIFYWADHGSGMPRSKRWPSDSGLHVPMIVYFPEKYRHLAPKEYAPGAKSDRLVSFVDLAPTLLSLADIQPPEWMQGHAFAGKFQKAPQPFIYGFRGRMDERTDIVRSVTDGRYVYVRNYMMVRSQGQHVNFQFQTPTTQIWWNLFIAGKTTEAQSTFWKTPKDPEELYDLQTDRDEVRNLAQVPEHQATLKKFRQAEQDLARRIRDTGLLTEAEVHERSGEDSPYDMGHDPKRYDFERVFAAAEMTSTLNADTLPELKKYLADPDSGVRYWGAAGILLRGQAAVDASKAELTAALKDSSASVRVSAAEALGRYGDATDLQRSLETLKVAADPTKTSAYVGIAAMNSIDALGTKAAPLLDTIRALPTRDPKTGSRVNQYMGQLKSDFLARFETQKASPAIAKPARPKRKSPAK